MENNNKDNVVNPNQITDSNQLFDAIMLQVALSDGFGNSQMQIGNSDINITDGKWQYNRRFLDWFLWTTLYNESWVFRNGIDKKNKATVSEIEIISDAEPTDILRVIAVYDKHRADLKDLLIQTAIYGGAASLMLIEGFVDKTVMLSPLDVSKIPKGAKMSLYTRDRWNGLNWEGRAGYEALGTPDFNKNKFYTFHMQGDNEATDKLKAHYSFVYRGRNRKATRFTEYQLAGWDMPEGQHIVEELLRDETTRASTVSLISKSLIEVFKMPGIRGLFSGLDGSSGSNNAAVKGEIESRIQAISRYRNFNNSSFLDKDDEYQQFQFSGFTGLAQILNAQKKFTAGAMEIPELVLYGSQETKGLMFMSDGKLSPDFEVYQQSLNERQEYILRPILDKMLPIIWRIATGKDMPEGTTYSFLPVFKESQLDKLKKFTELVTGLEKAYDTNSITSQTLAKEMRQLSKQTGVATNVTDEEINKTPDKFKFEIDRETKELENKQQSENKELEQPKKEEVKQEVKNNVKNKIIIKKRE